MQNYLKDKTEGHYKILFLLFVICFLLAIIAAWKFVQIREGYENQIHIKNHELILYHEIFESQQTTIKVLRDSLAHCQVSIYQIEPKELFRFHFAPDTTKVYY